MAQLQALGLSAQAVCKRAQAARLHRIHRAVYALTPAELLTRNGRFMAAVLACGPGAVLSHRSAAALHELRRTGRATVDVTVPGDTTRRHPGIDVHRSRTLTPADVTTVDGIPVTAVARTAFDLAAVLAQRPVEKAWEQAEVVEVLDLAAIADQLRRNPTAPGAAIVAVLLAGYDAGQGPTESGLEDDFLELVRAAGLPVPRRQLWVDPGDGEPMVRIDFAWPEQRLALETDSRRFHHTRARFETDRRKDQRLTLAGWQVIRVTDRQLADDPARIVRLVARLLRPA
jgi:hypothetical protein